MLSTQKLTQFDSVITESKYFKKFNVEYSQVGLFVEYLIQEGVKFSLVYPNQVYIEHKYFKRGC